jgi:hypothetical protein
MTRFYLDFIQEVFYKDSGDHEGIGYNRLA